MLNGPYSNHVLNSKLIVPYLNGKKFVNRLAFGYRTFYYGRIFGTRMNSIDAHAHRIKLVLTIWDVTILQSVKVCERWGSPTFYLRKSVQGCA